MANKKQIKTTSKPKPDKYQEKVIIKVDFNEALKLIAKHANNKTPKHNPPNE